MERQYAAHWEKPEWIYDQILRVEKRVDQPEIIALKTRSAAVFQQKMAQEFPEFFEHYTKIFFRAINKSLNKQLVLMLLKERKKIDTGESSFQQSNNEVIGASFNLMLRGLPEDLREKVANTYTDLGGGFLRSLRDLPQGTTTPCRRHALKGRCFAPLG